MRWKEESFIRQSSPASIFMFIFQVHISLIILHNSYHLSTRIFLDFVVLLSENKSKKKHKWKMFFSFDVLLPLPGVSSIIPPEH